jgi:glycosyltransferase involved in cell wall biosynthesis
VRLLFCHDNFAHSTGGAERSARALAEALAQRGHEVRAFEEARPGAPAVATAVPVEAAAVRRPLWSFDRDLETRLRDRSWEPLAAAAMERFRPDLVVTQNMYLAGTVRAARARGVPCVVLLRDHAPLCPIQFTKDRALLDCDRRCFRCVPLRVKLKFPLARRTLDVYAEGLRGAALVFANSEFVRRKTREFHGLEPELLHPPVEPPPADAARAGPPGDAWLFLKPSFRKGRPIFLELARAEPRRRFVVAGRASGRTRRAFARLPQVEAHGWTGDLGPLWRRCRGLLIPSIWPEPFGRVAVEAAFRGVPSVASRIGGLPEAVGAGGVLIDDPFDVPMWRRALEELDDPARHAALAAAARAHAKRFAPDLVAERFAEAVRRRLGLAV